MRHLMRNVVVACLIACVVPSIGLGEGEAETDSLVWYIEELEHDLSICHIMNTADMDSLRVEITIKDFQIEQLKKDQRKWWQSPIIWYSFGASLALLAK